MRKGLQYLTCFCVLLANSLLFAEEQSLQTVLAQQNAYPLIHVKQTLSSKTVESGTKSYVESGEVVTLTAVVTNLDDVKRDVVFSSQLPSGLTYIPDTLLVDGVTRQVVLKKDEQGVTTISVTGLDLLEFRNAKNSPLVISFQAEVDPFGQPVSFWLFSRVALQNNVEQGSASQSVVLVSKDFAEGQVYQSFNLSEEVSKGKNSAHRVDVKPGEVITLTCMLENHSLFAGEAILAAYLPQELKLIPNSLLVDGEPKGEISFLDNTLRSPDISVPAFGELGNPVKVSFKVKVDASVAPGTCLEHSCHVYAKGVLFSSTVSDQVVIMVH